MPRLLTVITVVGTAAMLWVGGHILLVGTDELGWHGPYDLVHHLEEAAHSAAGALGGFVGWLVNTLASAAVGLASAPSSCSPWHSPPMRAEVLRPRHPHIEHCAHGRTRPGRGAGR